MPLNELCGESAIPKLLTLVEVADALRLSPHTVRSFVKKGKLAPTRICRRLLFHPDAIEQLIRNAADREAT